MKYLDAGIRRMHSQRTTGIALINRLLTVLLSCVVLAASVLVSTPAQAQVIPDPQLPLPSADSFANFRTFCAFSHAGFDDPIVFPGEPGASHLHFFFGNTTTNAFTTPQSLRQKGSSTCQGTWHNKSAYWMPAVFAANGTPMVPDTHDIYYKHLNDEPATQVQELPVGSK